MEITLREFVRNFRRIRLAVESGDTALIRSAENVFIFSLHRQQGKQLLGCCSSLAPLFTSVPAPVEDPDTWESNR